MNLKHKVDSRYVDVCGRGSGTRVSQQKSLDINTRDRGHVAGCRVRWPESEGECRPWRLFISSPVCTVELRWRQWSCTSGLSITCPHAADNWSRLAFTYCAVPPTPSVAVPFSSTGEMSTSSTYIRRVYICHVTCSILLSMPIWYMYAFIFRFQSYLIFQTLSSKCIFQNLLRF